MEYIDFSYRDKRRFLRKYNFDVPISYKIVENVVHKVYSKFKKQKLNIDVVDITRNLLIDGYLAFEKDGSKLHSLDVLQLVYKIDHYHYGNTQTIHRHIPVDDIIYLSYGSIMGLGRTSLVEDIYRNMITKRDKEMVKIISNYIYDYLDEKIIHND